MDKEIIDKFVYERKYHEAGKKYVGGVDEVGRGPLAGPVVCACVIMPQDSAIKGVDDSKKLSAKKRELLNELILKEAVAVKICRVECEEIDEINILNAVKKCMAECIETIEVKPDVVLIDAVNLNVSVPTESIIKGDYLSYTIGCASIVAKVYRDRLMDEYDLLYPEYGFKLHKGYGTKFHIDKIKEIGPCPIHRRTFIKNFWAEAEKTKPQNF